MSTSARFTVGAGEDKTFRVNTQDYKTPAYAATLNIVPSEHITYVKPGALTGALTINVGVGTATTAPYLFDKMVLMFEASGAERTVTLGTGIAKTAATVVIADTKKAIVELIFDGTEWVESSRAIEG